jgi:hypothetical protein
MFTEDPGTAKADEKGQAVPVLRMGLEPILKPAGAFVKPLGALAKREGVDSHPASALMFSTAFAVRPHNLRRKWARKNATP